MTAASASAEPAADGSATAPVTRRRAVRAPSAGGRKAATSSPDTETGAAAPKRRAVRRTASPEASAAGDPAASGSDAATDAVAAPKRRATRKKAEPTA